MTTLDYDPAEGQAFQGDVVIIPMPADIAIARTDEIKPLGDRLILQRGEATRHHHAIGVGGPRPRHFRRGGPASASDIGPRNMLSRRPFAGAGRTATARLYRDAAAVAELARRHILTRTDLAIGCLVVVGGPVIVSHEEHEGIRLPPGHYYIGRQIKSADAQERRVMD